MTKIAIIAASGIGDALLMQICAANLQKIGHETVTFSPHLLQLTAWFPGFTFSNDKTLEHLRSFDAIVLQYDNTPFAAAIQSLGDSVYTFYGDYKPEKHGALNPLRDAIFDPTVCMARNIAEWTAKLFAGTPGTKDNGLVPPPSIIFQKYPKRIALHPLSTSKEKNWPQASFLQLKEKLYEKGWEPIFITHPEVANDWDSPLFPTLAELASFLYESGGLIGNDSGPGHLASNLGLSTLIIGSSESHLQFWRPGWREGGVAHPPHWVESFKLTRKKWMHFVSVNKVFKIFNKIK